MLLQAYIGLKQGVSPLLAGAFRFKKTNAFRGQVREARKGEFLDFRAGRPVGIGRSEKVVVLEAHRDLGHVVKNDIPGHFGPEHGLFLLDHGEQGVAGGFPLLLPVFRKAEVAVENLA
mgnify:CR=1 FL=1